MVGHLGLSRLFLGELFRLDLNDPFLGSLTIQEGGTITPEWAPAEGIATHIILIDDYYSQDKKNYRSINQ